MLTTVRVLTAILVLWLGILLVSSILLPFVQIDALLTPDEMRDPALVRFAGRLLGAAHGRYAWQFAVIGAMLLINLLLLERLARRAPASQPPPRQ